MASLKEAEEAADEGARSCCGAFCRPIWVCFGCFGFRFDGGGNYFYNVFRSFVFFFQTFLWLSFIMVLQAAITHTFDYLLSGRGRVVAYWVTTLVVVILAMVFTHIYMRLNTPYANQLHHLQSGLEKVIHSVIGNQLIAKVTEPAGNKRKKRNGTSRRDRNGIV